MEIITKAFHINKDGKKNIVFSPVDAMEYQRIEKSIKHGERYTIDIHKPQKGNHRKQLMAITRYYYDNFKGYKPQQVETFREALSIQAGATTVQKVNGKLYEYPLSWSPRNTDHDVFLKRIYNPICDVVEQSLGFEDEYNDKGNLIQSGRERLIVESMKSSGYNYDQNKVVI